MHGVLSAIALAVVGLIGPPALAAVEQPTDSESAVAAVEAVRVTEASEVVVDKPEPVVPDQAGGAVATTSQAVVALPAEAAGSIEVDALGSADFSISLPAAEPSSPLSLADGEVGGTPQATYDNGNDSVTVPLVQGSSVQVATVLLSSDAPSAFDYRIEFTDALSSELLEDGAVIFRDNAAEIVGWVAAPWAVDADGKSVPTHYVVDGDSVTQIVEHGDGYAYPVVADPFTGSGDFYNGAYLTLLPSGYIVNALPSPEGRRLSAPSVLSVHLAQLKGELGSQAYRVTPTVREQFYCHVVGNAFEPGTYNMESWRPYKDWGLQLNLWDRCNP